MVTVEYEKSTMLPLVHSRIPYCVLDAFEHDLCLTVSVANNGLWRAVLIRQHFQERVRAKENNYNATLPKQDENLIKSAKNFTRILNICACCRELAYHVCCRVVLSSST